MSRRVGENLRPNWLHLQGRIDRLLQARFAVVVVVVVGASFKLLSITGSLLVVSGEVAFGGRTLVEARELLALALLGLKCSPLAKSELR